MNKLSISKLEVARKNPKEFAINLMKESTRSFGGYPKSQRWLTAINEFHTSNDVSKAIKILENSFSNRKNTAKNRRELNDFMIAVDSYSNVFAKRNFVFIKSRENVNLEITKKIQLSGQIPLILMKPKKGFTAYFIVKEINSNWREELRFPIVQSYVAQQIFSCEIKDVDVGVIDFYTGEIQEETYEADVIENSNEELKKIGRAISRILK